MNEADVILLQQRRELGRLVQTINHGRRRFEIGTTRDGYLIHFHDPDGTWWAEGPFNSLTRAQMRIQRAIAMSKHRER